MPRPWTPSKEAMPLRQEDLNMDPTSKRESLERLGKNA